VADSKISPWKKNVEFEASVNLSVQQRTHLFFGPSVLFIFYFSKDGWKNEPSVFMVNPIQSCLWFLSSVQCDLKPVESLFKKNIVRTNQRLAACQNQINGVKGK
jgi:hypothetical protein